MNQSWMNKASNYVHENGASMAIARDVGVRLDQDNPFIEAPGPSIAPPTTDADATKRNLIAEWYDRMVSSLQARKIAASEDEQSRLGRVRRIVLRGIAVFASISCMTASVYFSFRGLFESQPTPIAGIMALTIVLTLSSAPELAVAMLRRRRFIIAIIAMSIALVAMVFSMSQTIQAIYNAKTASIIVSAEEASEAAEAMKDGAIASSSIEILRARLQRINESIAIDQAAVANYQAEIDKRLAGNEDPNSAAIRLLVANRNAARYRLNGDSKTAGAMAQAQAVEDEIMSLYSVASIPALVEKQGAARRLDFAAWLGDRLNQDADQVEFIQSVLPAMFIDIIAPVMMVVAFAL